MSLEPDSAERVWQGRLLGVTVQQWGRNEREIAEHPGRLDRSLLRGAASGR